MTKINVFFKKKPFLTQPEGIGRHHSFSSVCGKETSFSLLQFKTTQVCHWCGWIELHGM